MKDRLIKSCTEIRRSTISGYGVFALKDFKKGEIIEECPVFLFKKLPTKLDNYAFEWETDGANAVPLGYGCFYNHAELPNAAWHKDKDHQLIIFKALKNIYKGDEILTYYAPTWFAERKIKPKMRYPSRKNLLSFLGRIGIVVLLFFIFREGLFTFSTQQKNLRNPITTHIDYKASLPTKPHANTP